ncbi:copper chaperone PCu(A)C [Colwellia sp. M166]|uniref:copper chaperone PCu(A)C n=1 Tax=Colwellia sp. M166 TaxID=2583805 RepID=UPI00211DFF95|nr:copper chaperone PCu(A)C [Colwellia sp. M166]UUO24216.1 copper chaperone PCu(A)C [Colwellia sp. M166]|tara:strand:- start:2183 stop:2653 length:471 start_codon:yes stop_codon:yes gene_type:complete
MRNIFLVLILLFLFVNSAFAGTVFSGQNTEVLIENSFARESIPGTSISSAYMTISNLSAKDLRLISASSTVSDRIEIHEHTMANGLMRMRQRDHVDISAKDSMLFQPSGFHLMIFDLKQPLKAKENIIITLHFDDQPNIDVNYIIKGLKQKKHHHH